MTEPQNTNPVQPTTASSTSKLPLIVAIIIVIAFIGILKGCSFIHLPSFKIAATKVSNADTAQNITTKNTSVTYTPLATKANPHPKSITIKKPIEGKVVIKNNTITIQNSGFCFEPFIGYSYVLSYGLRPYISSRVFFMGDGGFELGLNDQRAFAGIDYRLPFVNLMAISAGETVSYLGSIEPYVSTKIQISLP